MTEFIPRIRELLSIPADDQIIIRKLFTAGITNKFTDLSSIFQHTHTICFGASPELEDIDQGQIKRLIRTVNLVAADGAANWLLEHDLIPDLIVTDLDGLTKESIETIVGRKIPLQVLTHGDNMDKSLQYLPNLLQDTSVMLVTQGIPSNGWHSSMGFTDGDRAVSVASKFSRATYLLGYNLSSSLIGRYSKPQFASHQPMTARKKLKLEIAGEIIDWIARKRNIYTKSCKLSPGMELSLEQFML